MAKVKTVKPEKDNAQTKENVKNIFLSLFNNERALKAAKTLPWWSAIIVVLLALVVAVLPITIGYANTYGSQVFKSKNYGLDIYQTSALLELGDSGYDYKINDNHKLLRYQNDTIKDWDEETDNDRLPVSNYVIKADDTETIAFEIYYSPKTSGGLKENRASTLVKELNDYRYIIGTTIRTGTEEAEEYISSIKEEEGENYVERGTYRPSYLLLYNEGLYLQLNTLNTTTSVASQFGDWNKYKGSDSLLTRLLGNDPKEISYVKDNNGNYDILRQVEETEKKGVITYTTYGEKVMNNFKTILNESFITNRDKNTLFNSLIYLGVYLALIMFMGLLLFLLTRGKNNQMNYLSYWVCTKLSFWASLAPAILAMIAGFIMPSVGQFAFILLFGMRTMWMSMRTLRPLNQ